MGGPAQPLLVPSADVIAKNMRAVEAARARSSPYDGVAAAKKNASLFDTTTTLEHQGNDGQVLFETPHDHDASTFQLQQDKFTRLNDGNSSNPLALLARLFSKSKSTEGNRANNEDEGTTPSAKRISALNGNEPSAVWKLIAKAFRPLEKASTIVSKLPNPTIFFLALVFTVLVLDATRPHYVRSVAGRVIVIGTYALLLPVAMLWGKASMWSNLRQGRDPLSHPVDHYLDEYEASLKKREEEVKVAQEELKVNRAKLDELRRELAKDPNCRDPKAVLVPSRKAAAMIADGALGAGYDEERATEVERRRKLENVMRSRQEWRERTEQSDGDRKEISENLQMLVSHAATGYRKHTKELKMRATPGTPRSGGTPLGSLRKVVAAQAHTLAPHFGALSHHLQNGTSGAAMTDGEAGSGGLRNGISAGTSDEAPRRHSEHSDRSVPSLASAPGISRMESGGRRRRALFRRKKRGDDEVSRSGSRIGLRSRGHSRTQSRAQSRPSSEAG